MVIALLRRLERKDDQTLNKLKRNIIAVSSQPDFFFFQCLLRGPDRQMERQSGLGGGGGEKEKKREKKRDR